MNWWALLIRRKKPKNCFEMSFIIHRSTRFSLTSARSLWFLSGCLFFPEISSTIFIGKDGCVNSELQFGKVCTPRNFKTELEQRKKTPQQTSYSVHFCRWCRNTGDLGNWDSFSVSSWGRWRLCEIGEIGTCAKKRGIGYSCFNHISFTLVHFFLVAKNWSGLRGNNWDWDLFHSL